MLLATKEYDGITVAKSYVQISSIMPQKRNPVSIEHARAITSSALGEAFTVFQMIHNTPFGDIVDTEDDLRHIYIKGLKRQFVFLYDECSDPNDESRRRNVKSRSYKHAITITDFADVLTKTMKFHFGMLIMHKCYCKYVIGAEKELHELQFKEVNMYLQEHFKINLLEKVERNYIARSFYSKRNVYGAPSKKRWSA